MEILTKIKDFFQRIIEVLMPIIGASILLGVIFGPETPFVGDVYINIKSILGLLGEDGLLALVSIIIILAYLNKD